MESLNETRNHSSDLKSTSCSNNNGISSEKSTDKRMNSHYSRHRRFDQLKDKKRHRKNRYYTNGDSRNKNRSSKSRSRHKELMKHRRNRSKKSKSYGAFSQKLASDSKIGHCMLDPVADKLKNTSNQSKKMPVLASIELIKDKCADEQSSCNNDNNNNNNNFDKKPSSIISCNLGANEKILFKDYVLIPSGTKFKHLVYTVLDHVHFPNKNEYSVIDGYLKIENWKPIRLDNISSIIQCPLMSTVTTATPSITSSSVSLSNLNTKSDHPIKSHANAKLETDNSNTNSNTYNNNSSFVNSDKLIDNNNNNIKNSKNNSDIEFPNNEFKNNVNNNNNHVNSSINNNENNNSSNNIRANELTSSSHISRPTSLNTSSSRISTSCSSRCSSSRSRSTSCEGRRRSLSSSSNNKHSDYSDYENQYESDEDTNDSIASKSSDNMTVNDMLSHVISFATLSIKLSSNRNRQESQPKLFQQSQFNSKEDDLIKSEIQPQYSASAQKLSNPQQSLIQNYMISLQQQQQQQLTKQESQISGSSLASLIQNATLFSQTNAKSSEDAYKKFNELLLPILMMSNSANSAAAVAAAASLPTSPVSSTQNNTPITNYNNSHVNNTTNTSPLTSSQLATLLPILNLPILSQLLNAIKNNSSETNSQQQLKSSLQDSLNLNSATVSTLSRLLKANSNGESISANPLNFSHENTNLLNQPLNLCKDISQASNSQNSSSKKSPVFNSTKPSPPSLPLHNNSDFNRNNFLSVNVNGSNNSNNSANTASNNIINTNSLATSIFNTSPSPSISSSSCSTISSTDKTLGNQVHAISQQNNQKNSFSNVSHTKSSYMISNRRQRERTTFDPQEEITRLMQIFERTHHPTRYQIASICDSLNSLSCRRDKKPLEPYNIQYWFKNARAALRRKVKGEVGDTNGISRGVSNNANSFKNEFDPIFNTSNTNHNSQNHSVDDNEGYIDNYGEEENELNDEEFDDDYDPDHPANGFSIDESKMNNNDVDFNNNNNNIHSGDLNLKHKESHLSLLKNELNRKNDHVDDQINDHSNSEPYENYNEDNTIDEDDDNQFSHSNYNNINDNDCNESFDDEANFKNNNSHLNSSGMNNLLAGHQKISNKTSTMNNSSICNNRRNRVFIDPISEVPILEHYFSIETYPDHYLIEKICENLNKGEYRFKFPKLESRNIQLWFKNHRAKLKRLKSTPGNANGSLNANNANSDDQLQAISDIKSDEQNFNNNLNTSSSINI